MKSRGMGPGPLRVIDWDYVGGLEEAHTLAGSRVFVTLEKDRPKGEERDKILRVLGVATSLEGALAHAQEILLTREGEGWRLRQARVADRAARRGRAGRDEERAPVRSRGQEPDRRGRAEREGHRLARRQARDRRGAPREDEGLPRGPLRALRSAPDRPGEHREWPGTRLRGSRGVAMRKPVSEKTMAESARVVAANKAEAALAASGKPMTAAEVRDACGFSGAAKAARVLGGLVRKGIAKTLPPSTTCQLPRTWFLA